MDPMLAFQQLLDYQPERKRQSLSVDTAHINFTHDGSYGAKDLTSRTFQTPGLLTYIVANGMAGDTILDTFKVVEPAAPDFDLERALKLPSSEWFLREVRINDNDEIELIFMRTDGRRITREGVKDSDLQTVKISDDCDTLFAIFNAADSRAWILSQTWTRTDGRMLLRIWELEDGVKKCLCEKEGIGDDDGVFGTTEQDWLLTYYDPPALLS